MRDINISLRKVSPSGLALLKELEGLRLEAYRDEGGVLTIGYGHTGYLSAYNPIHIETKITEKQAEELLDSDLCRVLSCIEEEVSICLNDNQYAALAIFIFNIGIEAFKKSKLLKCLIASDIYRAEIEWLRWDHVNGKQSPGLLLRRKRELELFKTPPI